MQVLPRRERLDQALVPGEVGHDPHLDLAVVRRHQRLVALADDERLPDPPALGGADRDVLQVRVGRGEPAGRGDRLLERRVDAAGVVDHRQQAVDDGAQPGDVAVAEQVLHERVPGLLEQPGQRVGVRGVPGLVLLRLGQPQLVEEHRLQLLRRPEVHLAADDGVALGGRGGDARRRTPAAAPAGSRRSAAMPRYSIAASTRVSGSSMPPSRASPPRWPSTVSRASDRSLTATALRTSACAASAATSASRRPEPVEGQLALGLGGVLELALEVPDREVTEVERPLPGQRQVGGQRGVADDALQLPAARPDREVGALDLVHDLLRGRVGQPRGERLLVGDVEVGAEVDERGVVVGRRQRDAGQLAGAPAPGAAEDQPGPAGAGVGLQPVAEAAGGHVVLGDVEAALDLGLGAGERGEEPVAQHPELQVVEEGVHLVAVPGLDGEVGRAEVERDGAVELGEPPVLQHRGQVLAQLLADLALDRVDLVDQRVERAVLADPLGRGLLPHARDARQVVARVAAQRREVGVLRRA